MHSSIAEAFRKSTWFFRGGQISFKALDFSGAQFYFQARSQACKKVGAQNQIARPIETQLETLHFAL